MDMDLDDNFKIDMDENFNDFISMDYLMDDQIEAMKQEEDGSQSVTLQEQVGVKMEHPYEEMNDKQNAAYDVPVALPLQQSFAPSQNMVPVAPPQGYLPRPTDINSRNIRYFYTQLSLLNLKAYDFYIAQISKNTNLPYDIQQEVNVIRMRIKQREDTNDEDKDDVMILEDEARELILDNKQLEKEIIMLKKEKNDIMQELQYNTNIISTLMSNKEFSVEYAKFYEQHCANNTKPNPPDTGDSENSKQS
eukprot:TRINITY_DN2209_c0_g1_i1.p1 TRINITY_DN2209_c0_g1~~TRINITY_DN2209_c0_g1_i1.p1  ORF type:complete len:249 (+),score=70.32 TRINITY_DN2209_c0_g1_i1:55-801(+)